MTPDERPWRLPVALLLALTLLLAACGGGDDDEGEGPATSANEQVIEAEGDPVAGGSVVFALEAETSGWDPTLDRWAVSGHQVGQTIFDQLATFNEDGEAVPYLAEELTPNDDYTQWDIKLREGIEFHDGTPLTSEAVKVLFEQHAQSGLTRPTVRPVDSVEVVDELTARVNLNSPWASFPVVLTSQVGYLPSPTQFESGDQARRDTPIGTGPFTFDRWEREASLTAVKNEDYWRQDENGVQLPYLDRVEFRPIVENDQRLAGLQSADIDMFHTTDPDVIVDLREMAEREEAQVVEDGAVGEETFLLLNTLEPPLDDQRVRRALAMATDRDTYVAVVDRDIRPVASSPFIEGSPWYSEEAAQAYPGFDPDGARALIEAYEAEVGPVQLTVKLTPSATNRDSTGLVGEQWTQVGIDVTFEQVEQAQLINDALSGDFQVNLWRQFGATDPDAEYVWWDQENASDIGTAALNFARIRSQELTDAMQAGREADTFEERKAAYDEAQMVINEQVPYIWLSHTIWAIAANPTVRNIAVATLPDGSPRLGFGTGFAGAISMTEVWLEQ